MIIKVCGMRESENIRAVEQCRIDWMGFIFYSQLLRHVNCKPAYLPESVKRIGVFVDAPCDYVKNIISEYGLYGVQLHGHETPEYCRILRASDVKVIKALDAMSIRCCMDYEGLCDYFLFDTPTSQYGGTGRKFDWSLLDNYTMTTPFLLSGGIGPENLDDLLLWNHPRWVGIDLNSRFEIQPAVKDWRKLQEFVASFRNNFPE